MSGRAWARALWALVVLTSCQAPEARDKPSPPARRQTDETAEDYVGPTLPRARVLLKDAYGGMHGVEVEVAADSTARTRGLMWRKDLPHGQGMLFIFPGEEEIQAFWMRNTLIPLDLLFINAQGRIVGIVENAAPQSLVRRQVGVPSRYVLEVPGGFCAKAGITRGGGARFEGLERIPVSP
jgi:uncharacterized protein